MINKGMIVIWILLIVLKKGLDTMQQFVKVCTALILKIFVTENQDRNTLLCSLNDYGTIHEMCSDSIISEGGRQLPKGLTTYVMGYLSVSLNIIDT